MEKFRDVALSERPPSPEKGLDQSLDSYQSEDQKDKKRTNQLGISNKANIHSGVDSG
jgi:hypothetical protein